MIADTTFLVDVMRGRSEKAQKKMEEIDRTGVVVSISSISIKELWKGAVKQVRQDEKQKIGQMIQSFHVLPFYLREAKCAAEIDVHLESTGQVIDAEDVMIAATALCSNQPLITANVKHFKRVSGLKLVSY